jgi:peroxiredoxin
MVSFMAANESFSAANGSFIAANGSFIAANGSFIAANGLTFPIASNLTVHVMTQLGLFVSPH